MADLSDGSDQAIPRSGLLAGTILVAFALVTCFGGLGSGLPMGDHECIVAQSARQTIQSGNWLIPHLGEIPRIRKTPLGIWLIAAASEVVDNPDETPVTNLSARLPSAAAGMANVLVIWWLGTMLFGARAGLVAGFVSAGCLATIMFSHNAQVDMMLTLLTTLSFACFWRGALHNAPSRRFMAGFYVAFALAMMAKAPLPLAIVGLSLAVYWFATVPMLTACKQAETGGHGNLARDFFSSARHQVGHLGRLWFIPGAVLFLILAGAWPLYIYFKIDNALALWGIEYLDRYSGQLSSHHEPFLYYLPMVFGLTAPFMLSIPEAVAAPFLQQYKSYRPGLAFAFTWAIVGTLFLSTASFKRPHYLLSVTPAYCLLLAPVLDRLFFGPVIVAAWAVRSTCRVIPVVLAIGIVVGGIVLHTTHPSLVPVYAGIGLFVLITWTAACFSYARDARTASFAQLLLGVLLISVTALPVIGQHINPNAEGRALAQQLREHGVQHDDAIYWVGGRPDASIEFYAGFQIQRLINEIEMTTIRSDRRTLSADLYKEFLNRIQMRLREPHPVYLIMSAGHLAMLNRNSDIQLRVLFQLEGFHTDPGEELVVVTQIPTSTQKATTNPSG